MENKKTAVDTTENRITATDNDLGSLTPMSDTDNVRTSTDQVEDQIQIVDLPMMVMPTAQQAAQVLAQKFDQNVVAPVQMTAEEIAMNARIAANNIASGTLGSTAGKLAGAAAVMVVAASCDTETPTPEVPVDVIDRTTDNPVHRAEFESNIKPKVLGEGVATFDFDVVWNGTNYVLKPKSIVDMGKAQKLMQDVAGELGYKADNLGFSIYYDNNKGVRIAWVVPYSLVVELNGNHNLNDDKFDDYRVVSDVIPDGGDPDATVSKGVSGFLSLDITNQDNIVIKRVEKISPYYFGR